MDRDNECLDESTLSSSSGSSIDINLSVARRGDSTDFLENEVHDDIRNPFTPDLWLLGGTFGSRSAILLFKSSALANTDESAIQNMPAYKLHITYKAFQAETKLLAKLLECHGVTEVINNSNNFNILWTGSHPKPGLLRALAPHQRVNHFPRSYEMTRKDHLYKNIESMQHAKGFKNFDFIPQTFVMPSEYKDLCTVHNRVKGPWIVKPVASSRGRGIFIVENPNQVPLEEPVVVAKYLARPLLVKGHKCDLRLYVVVTSFDPLLIYIYEEGLVRLATVKYDVTNKELWNPCMHLCNYSINKYHSDYVKSDDPSAENVGHKWTLSALLRHLKSQGRDTALLMSQVEDVVVKAILASANSIIAACKMFVPNCTTCFELFGFDILIDEDLKPWLLEVNLSPSLGCDTPLDVRVKSAMLADLLTLVGVPAIDPLLRPKTSNKSMHSTKSKQGNCRRVQSADGFSNTLPNKKSNGSTIATKILPSNIKLTNEDVKLITMAKGQFERRGGYVRIFPTADSWTKYSQYLDPVTGIPISGSGSNLFNLSAPRNYNFILHTQLFPEAKTTLTKIYEKPVIAARVSSLDRRRDFYLDNFTNSGRQDRYERKLKQGHTSSLSPIKVAEENYAIELKKRVCDMMKDGKRLNQREARKTFSQYLNFVLKRISSAPEQEANVEMVVKFLQKASKYLKTPFFVKTPNEMLYAKDRAAIVAKQLNDFLYLYNRETDLYGSVLEREHQSPNKIFAEFLQHARESDLEEVLTLQSVPTNEPRQYKNLQGLLKCLPNMMALTTCVESPVQNKPKRRLRISPLS